MRQMCVMNNVLSFGNSVTSLVVPINALRSENPRNYRLSDFNVASVLQVRWSLVLPISSVQV